jgi:predicted nucleotidyltransferase
VNPKQPRDYEKRLELKRALFFINVNHTTLKKRMGMEELEEMKLKLTKLKPIGVFGSYTREREDEKKPISLLKFISLENYLNGFRGRLIWLRKVPQSRAQANISYKKLQTYEECEM